ncbi:hypothetical protein F5X98DRAFT_381803 [Xylaria grammica]|nr:hypothetical protein F5X98DRAFT_381803 [Xylaria grammica]
MDPGSATGIGHGGHGTDCAMREETPSSGAGEDGVGRARHVFYFRREEWVYGRKVTERRESVIGARAYRIPQVLMISGVGPSTVLEEHGIPVLYDAPQVKQNFYHHFALYLNS